MENHLHYINKQTLSVVIFTEDYKIEGLIHVLYNHRALDVLNADDHFVAVTNAQVSSLATNNTVYEGDFIAVNKDDITLLYEA